MAHRHEPLNLPMFAPSLVDAKSIRHFQEIVMRSFNRTAMVWAQLICESTLSG
jgi:hypothetical protein